MSKEELIAAIRACAGKLARAPTLRELMAGNKKIKRYDIQHHFGGYTGALRACEVNTPGSGRVADLNDLFLDWAATARALGRIPTIAEYDRNSRFSVRPLINRFGNWTNVPPGLEAYAEHNGLSPQWRDVLAMAGRKRQERARRSKADSAPAPGKAHEPRVRTDLPLLGPPLSAASLTHSPTNESGVIFLFGSMARELGFVVTHIQNTFPDCEAVRQVASGRWQRVRVEFEYESRNFLRHLHRAEDCDVIVCWIHNWTDCPLDVVELRSAVANRSVQG